MAETKAVLASAVEERVLHVRDGEAGGAFVIEDAQRRVAEMTYKTTKGNTVVIDHTWVAEPLRGRGVARRLLDSAVQWARDKGLRIVPACSYVRAQFDADKTIHDVLSRLG